jgi:hypothetical protein
MQCVCWDTKPFSNQGQTLVPFGNCSMIYCKFALFPGTPIVTQFTYTNVSFCAGHGVLICRRHWVIQLLYLAVGLYCTHQLQSLLQVQTIPLSVALMMAFQQAKSVRGLSPSESYCEGSWNAFYFNGKARVNKCSATTLRAPENLTAPRLAVPRNTSNAFFHTWQHAPKLKLWP